MIDNNLGSVSEISKLCLPESEGVRMSLSVSKLVAKNSKLREMRVGCNESSLALLFKFFRDDLVDRIIISLSVLIKNMGVSMTESSSLDILS